MHRAGRACAVPIFGSDAGVAALTVQAYLNQMAPFLTISRTKGRLAIANTIKCLWAGNDGEAIESLVFDRTERLRARPPFHRRRRPPSAMAKLPRPDSFASSSRNLPSWRSRPRTTGTPSSVSPSASSLSTSGALPLRTNECWRPSLAFVNRCARGVLCSSRRSTSRRYPMR